MSKSNEFLVDNEGALRFRRVQRDEEPLLIPMSKKLLLRSVVCLSRPERQDTAKEDVALLAALGKGDPDALTALYDKYSAVVYSASLRILRDPSAAEDVVQEIFMQIWRGAGAFDMERGSLAGWLAILSRNRSIDLQRRRRPSESVDEAVLASSFDLAGTAERNLMLVKAQGLIEQLSRQQQETLHMAFFDGLTYAEIAHKTGTPLGTIKTIIRRALQTLREAAEAAQWPRLVAGKQRGASLHGKPMLHHA